MQKTITTLKKDKFLPKVFTSDERNVCDRQIVSDNNTFWKSVKLFFSSKGLIPNNILLVKENETRAFFITNAFFQLNFGVA